jgi:asparagine synthase (glutamine-hydrolysing)
VSTYYLAAPGTEARARDRLEPLMARHGYRVCRRIEIFGRSLVVFDNPERSVLSAASHPDGSWALALGPFGYAGQTGSAALAAYLSAFDPGGDLWVGTRGQFTLLLRAQGRLHVICDGLGAVKVYHDPDHAFLSNSFLAVLASLERARLEPYGCYAYAWAGGCFAGTTFVREIGTLPAAARAEVGPGVSVVQHACPVLANLPPVARDGRELVEHATGALGRVIDGLRGHAAGPVRLSFSGGYDSRLLLAALRAAGVEPELFVYGADGERDVEVARAVARDLGLHLDRIEKDAVPPPAPDAFPHAAERALVAFDGWKNPGLFDHGADLDDRRRRHRGGGLPVNGSLGEIFRNFFALWRPCHPVDDVVSSFYHAYDPRWATDRFDPRAYHDELVRQMRRQLPDGQGPRVTQQHAHLLYPLFRGRFWTAREGEINQRVGPTAFPYLEPELIACAAATPPAWRRYGRLQAGLIQRLDPAAAAVPNGYGFRFDEPVPLRRRASEWASTLRPMWLRRQRYRQRARAAPDRMPTVLDRDYLARIVDPSFPRTRALFHVDRITDAGVYNRIATLEYLAERFDIAPPDQD